MNRILKVRKYKAGYEVREEVIQEPFKGWSTEPIECPVDAVSETVDFAGQLNESFKRVDEITMKSAYTPEGHYIGNQKWAHRLCKTWGIKPELLHSTNKVCSIGFSSKDGKWYGWSHRAICGFQIGDVVQEGDCCAMSGWTEDYLIAHPEDDISLPVGFTAKTIDDAKQMAMAFAESVG